MSLPQSQSQSRICIKENNLSTPNPIIKEMAELTLTQSPEAQTPGPSSPNGQGNHINGFAIYSEDYRDPQPSNRMRNTTDSKKGNLHPYVQTLSVQDLESCVALENAAFPEQQRCSREKVNTLTPSCANELMVAKTKHKCSCVTCVKTIFSHTVHFVLLTHRRGDMLFSGRNHRSQMPLFIPFVYIFASLLYGCLIQSCLAELFG